MRLKAILNLSLILVVALNAKLSLAKESSNKSSYAQTLPNFSLKDPAGKKQSKSEIAKNGLVIVVTAPILSNKDAQEGWAKFLPPAKGEHKGHIVFVEDMKPSSFKGKAMSSMKKDYKPGKDPILLVDQQGSLRSKLKVKEKKTVVLVYNKDGKLVASEEGKPSAELASELWKKLDS